MDAATALHRLKADARSRALVMLVNLVGIGYGFYYYLPQFAVTPPRWWLLVPDSPLAVLLAQASLLAYTFGRRWDLLDAFAVVANVVVGLWTVFVLVYYPAFGTFTDPLTSLNFYLLWGHLGMALEALVFLPEMDLPTPRGWGVLVAWFGGHVLVDYGPVFTGYAWACDGLRPITVPCVAGKETVTTWATACLTLAALAGLYAYLRWRGPSSVEPRLGAE